MGSESADELGARERASAARSHSRAALRPAADVCVALGRARRELAPLCLSPSASVRDALRAIGASGLGIVLLTDARGRLLATVTDGDVRRAILAGVELDGPVAALLRRGAGRPRARPVTASVGTPRAELLRAMKKRHVRHVPIVGEGEVVVDLVTLDELVPAPPPPVRALVMAGGYGRRLRPWTAREPKPMLRVGDRPILERTIGALRAIGIQKISISTHYRADRIRAHFGGGERFGVELHYIDETEPLGTAGALRHVPRSGDPVLMINGDILTTVDYRAMIEFHRDQNSPITVGVRRVRFEVPYGVVDARGSRVRALREKPRCEFLVNAGIYVLEPSAVDSIRDRQRFDMTDLIATLLERGEPVTSFPILERWLDVGRPADLARACEEYRD